MQGKDPQVMKEPLLFALLVSLPLLAQNVVTNPTGTQTIVQPAGTNLNVNRFETIRYADQFSGVDFCKKVNAAAIDLAAQGGGVVDARGLVGAQSCASDPFATVSVPVQILIGY